MADINLGEYIKQIIEEKGYTITWVAEKADINYKTLFDKLNRDTITAKELLRLAKVLDIELEYKISK